MNFQSDSSAVKYWFFDPKINYDDTFISLFLKNVISPARYRFIVVIPIKCYHKYKYLILTTKIILKWRVHSTITDKKP